MNWKSLGEVRRRIGFKRRSLGKKLKEMKRRRRGFQRVRALFTRGDGSCGGGVWVMVASDDLLWERGREDRQSLLKEVLFLDSRIVSYEQLTVLL